MTATSPSTATTSGAADRSGPAGLALSTRFGGWAVAAGILGVLATLVFDGQAGLTREERATGASVINEIDRLPYHLRALFGFLAVGCLLVFAAAWRRWTDEEAPNSVAARTVAGALTASAGALIVGYGVAGQLSIYLADGLDDGFFPDDGLYTLFMITDLAPYYAWWGVAVAAAATVWLGLRERVVARWLGAVSVLAFVIPLAFVAVAGLTGFAGVAGPVWLIVLGGSLLIRRHPSAG